MLIVVDKGLPDAEAAFAPFGRVIALPGRQIAAEHVRDADALVVRSVTRVGPALLVGSKVCFVGAATSGTDHVDVSWLAEQNIRFASAAGCNARPVAEYVFTAIFEAACRLDSDPLDMTLGVIGVGRIGSIVADWAEQVGIRVLRCDPPLAEQGGGPFVSPAQIAEQADIITLHVPLTLDGPHATRDMINAAWFARLRKRPIYINTSRGDIVDESAFRKAAAEGGFRFAAVDVWRNEPAVDPRTIAAADIATPHIAGYSQGAKDRAIGMIVDALRTYLCESGADMATNAEPPAEQKNAAADNSQTSVNVMAPGGPWWRAAASANAACLDLATVDARFRAAAGNTSAESFDDIRLSLARRREFTHIDCGAMIPAGPCRRYLNAAGFRTS